MAYRISENITKVQDLARVLDGELQRLDRAAKLSIVGNKKLAETGESYLYTDDGTLKFYNATTGTTQSVTLT